MKLKALITLTVVIVAVLFLLDNVLASTMNANVATTAGTGVLSVEHHAVVNAEVYMEGGGSITSPYVDYVEITAYVLDAVDAGYYNITIVVYFADVGQAYVASGIVYLTTTPTRLYFSVPATYQGSDTRVYAFAKWLGP